VQKIITINSGAHTDSARWMMKPDSESFTGSAFDNYNEVAVYSLVSVVIPTLNEAKNLPHVLAAIPHSVREIIVVDGGSQDGTPDVARMMRSDVIVINQYGRGKGDALALGFANATGQIIVMLDADGSTNPCEIPRFLETLVVGGADFAKGSRFMNGGGSEDMTLLRRLGNAALRALVNMGYRTSYTDLCYGYCAFWRDCLPAFQLAARSSSDEPDSGGMRSGDGFEIETLLCVRAARAGLNIAEVPSFELPRKNGSSNLRAVHDGLRVLRVILGNLFGYRKQRKLVEEDSYIANRRPSKWVMEGDDGPTLVEQGLNNFRPEIVL